MIDSSDRIVIGAPGVMAIWMFEVIRELAKRNRSGKVDIALVDRLDPIGARPGGPGGRVLLTHFPNAQIIDALTTLDDPVLYLDEPSDLVVDHLMRRAGHTPIEAIRVCSAAYVANRMLRNVRRLAVLSRDTSESLYQVLFDICAHLELDVAQEDLRAFAAHIAPPDVMSVQAVEAVVARYADGLHSKTTADAADVSPAFSNLASAILEPCRDWARMRVDRAIVWPGQIFYHPEHPTEHVPRIIDLTGPARMLSHGPYFYLPRGAYEAEVIIACSDISSGATFRLEVHAGTQCLVRVRLQPQSAGAFSGRFSFAHSDVSAEVQAQVISERGAIHGELSIVQLAFMPREAVGGAGDDVSGFRRSAAIVRE